MLKVKALDLKLETRKLWKKFYGPTTLRKGIEYSRNLMTVRIAKILGLEEILISKKLNIYEEIPELLSVSLGEEKLH